MKLFPNKSYFKNSHGALSPLKKPKLQLFQGHSRPPTAPRLRVGPLHAWGSRGSLWGRHGGTGKGLNPGAVTLPHPRAASVACGHLGLKEPFTIWISVALGLQRDRTSLWAACTLQKREGLRPQNLLRRRGWGAKGGRNGFLVTKRQLEAPCREQSPEQRLEAGQQRQGGNHREAIKPRLGLAQGAAPPRACPGVPGRGGDSAPPRDSTSLPPAPARREEAAARTDSVSRHFSLRSHRDEE